MYRNTKKLAQDWFNRAFGSQRPAYLFYWRRDSSSPTWPAGARRDSNHLLQYSKLGTYETGIVLGLLVPEALH